MFAPKIARAQPKLTANPTSGLAPKRSMLVGPQFGPAPVHQAHGLQPNPCNQAMLRILAQQGLNRAAKNVGDDLEQQGGTSENMMAREAPRGASWDFSKISIHPPNRRSEPQVPSWLVAPPLPGIMQPKLTVGPVDDPLEHEADRVADQVMRMPAPLRTERSGSPASPGEAPASVHDVLGAPGHPLDAAARAFFEPQFGHDFADVSIHDDAAAARSARDVGALAYAVGRHVVVDAVRHHPASVAGQRLLAHELAHVVQQRQAGPVVRRQAAQPAPTGLPDKIPSGTVSRDDVLPVLTAFLTRVQTDAGTYSLKVSAPVWQALRMLVEGDGIAWVRIDSFLSRKDLPATPDEFARQAVTRLPPVIPRSRLDHLERIPTTEAKDTRPTTLGTAVGAVFDATIAPLIKALPIPEDQRAKIADAARSAVGDGLVGLVDAAMAGSPIDDKAKTAIHSAVAAAITQPAAGRKVEPTSPYVQPAPPSAVQPAPPSAAPPMPALPGGSIQLSPPVNIPVQQSPKVDIPEGGGPKPAAPAPPTAGALEQAIQGLDRNSLVPPEARGQPAAAKFADAQLFAREVAYVLDAAQRARRFSAVLTLREAYRDVQDTVALFDEVARIVRVVADALPHHASQVGQVDVWIEDTMRHRVIPLHQSP